MGCFIFIQGITGIFDLQKLLSFENELSFGIDLMRIENHLLCWVPKKI
jgi:hypothetical protein